MTPKEEKAGMTAHAYHPTTKEAETGESRVQGYPEVRGELKTSLGYLLHRMNLSQKVEKEKRRERGEGRGD